MFRPVQGGGGEVCHIRLLTTESSRHVVVGTLRHLMVKMMMTKSDDAWFFQVVLEQDGDAAELCHQHSHAGHVERPSVTT